MEEKQDEFSRKLEETLNSVPDRKKTEFHNMDEELENLIQALEENENLEKKSSSEESNNIGFENSHVCYDDVRIERENDYRKSHIGKTVCFIVVAGILLGVAGYEGYSYLENPDNSLFSVGKKQQSVLETANASEKPEAVLSVDEKKSDSKLSESVDKKSESDVAETKVESMSDVVETKAENKSDEVETKTAGKSDTAEIETESESNDIVYDVLSEYLDGKELGVTNRNGIDSITLYEDFSENADYRYIPKNKVVSINDTEVMDGVNWYHINYLGIEGWVPEDSLELIEKERLQNDQGTVFYVHNPDEIFVEIYADISDNTEKIAEIENGHEISITNVSDNYCQILYDDQDGWINAEYVDMFIPGYYYVNVDDYSSLNVRQDPQMDSEVLKSIGYGERYRIEEISNGWGRVRFPDETSGWVGMQYMTPCNQD